MFPLDSVDMEKFIFDGAKQNWENYLSNIKKLLHQTCITTNDTLLEEKINQIDNKYHFNVDSSNNSYEDKHSGFFSNNDDDNYDEFI